tara:strand:+ start:232 stop:468 length:237 start_codon:yes stop_codon:yes gene_type:complete
MILLESREKQQQHNNGNTMTHKKYLVKGRTYPVKEELKTEWHASWDRAEKAWVILGQLSFHSLQEIRGLGPKIWIEIV